MASPPQDGIVGARTRRWPLDWRVLVGAVVLCGFGLWALTMLREAGELRQESAEHSALLRELQASQRAVMTNGPETPQVTAALRVLGQVARRAEALPASPEAPKQGAEVRRRAAELGEAAAALQLSLDEPGVRDDARVELVLAVDGLATALWVEEGRLERALGRQWMSALGLASSTVLTAAVALLLFIRARDGRRAAEALGERLEAAAHDAQQAQLAAQDASRAKSEFLATVSHEIRTPMTAILGTVELLSMTDLDDHQRDCVAVVNSGGQALLHIINDVLDLSRIEAGRVELKPRPFDLFGLMDALMLLFATPAETKGLSLTLFIAADVPREVIGDATRLRQVLVNLVGNALKFTPDGEVGVRVELEAPGLLRFVVSDTGPGLPEGSHERVFEAFSQVDGSSSRKHGGTGLGLTISRRLVEAMGGRIGVRSVLGEGASFHFTAHLPGEGEPVGQLTLRRVLVVGEGPCARAVAEQLLAWGLLVERARDPLEAQAAIRAQSSYDYVFIDLPENEAAQVRVPSPGLALRVGDFHERRTVRGGLVRPVRPSSLLRLLGDDGPTWPPGVVESSDPPSLPPGAKRRVLVVDDNATNRLVVGRLLEALGCVVESVSGGDEALERLRSDRYDLVLMDYDMPGMDGLTATEHIRALGGSFSQLPIVGLTGHATPEARQAGLDAGMDDSLSKPVRMARLKQLLRQLSDSGAPPLGG